MKKNYFVLLMLLYITKVSSQCPFSGTPLTKVGSDYTFCVDNINSITTPSLNAGQYVVVNVVKGFSYTFSVGNVFGGTDLTENLTILDNSTNSNVTPSAFSSGNTGTSITWTSSITGKIKILLSRGSCLNNNTVGGTLTLVLNSIGNTQDSQTSFGTDQWIGHVYNYTGTPPQETSPASPSNTNPFTSSNYVGYYNINSETISESFGGSLNCFPLYSNGQQNVNIYTDIFAVRYRMRSTKSGCYFINTTGDDGIRIYVDGVLVFNEWKLQGPTNYCNNLVYLNGNSDIIFDYYEYDGGNLLNFSLTPYSPSSNSIAGSSTILRCSGVSSGLLDGSSFSYCGGTNNPTISFQWQVSTDNIIFTDISGATSEDYTPPTVTTATNNVTRYYRRRLSANASNAGSCSFFTNVITIITSPGTPTTPIAIIGNTTQCPSQSGINYSVNPVANATTYNWTVPTGWSITSGNGTSIITVTSGTTGQNGNIIVNASNGCGTSSNITFAVTVSNDLTVAGTINSNQSICNGTKPSNITLTGNTGNVVKWQMDDNNSFSSPTDINNTTSTLTGNEIGTITTQTFIRALVQIGTCNSVYTNIVTISISGNSTWNGISWSPSTPTGNTSLIFNGNFSSTGNISGCSCNVNSGNVIINSGHTMNLINEINVNGGSFTIDNNANLIQVNNATNSGNIIVKRKTNAIMRLDYSAWSSPVNGQYLQTFSPNTLSNRFYTYNTTTNLYNVVSSPSSTFFSVAKGYLIRTPNNFPTTPTIWTGTFTGVPNNGNISISLDNIGAGHRFNLIGNPYPSCIDMYQFVSDNSSNITGTLYFWRKTNSTVTSPGYCTWNNGTFVSNGEAQVFNPNDIIRNGQGFIVEATTTGSVVNFNNNQRINDVANQFFKVTNQTNQFERSRYWLNVTGNDCFSQMAMVYDVNASNDIDFLDANYFNNGAIFISSILSDNELVIQSKPLPIDFNESIPLKFKSDVAGEFNFTLDHFDGNFEDDNIEIILKDNYNLIETNLKTASYNFFTEIGEFNNRFELIYQTSQLSNYENIFSNNVVVYKKDNIINVVSSKDLLKEISIYDINGRQLKKIENINSLKQTFDFHISKQVLLVEIISINNEKLVKKIVF